MRIIWRHFPSTSHSTPIPELQHHSTRIKKFFNMDSKKLSNVFRILKRYQCYLQLMLTTPRHLVISQPISQLTRVLTAFQGAWATRSSSRTAEKTERSSARSICKGFVPRIFTPLWYSGTAKLLGICPPTEIMQPLHPCWQRERSSHVQVSLTLKTVIIREPAYRSLIFRLLCVKADDKFSDPEVPRLQSLIQSAASLKHTVLLDVINRQQ